MITALEDPQLPIPAIVKLQTRVILSLLQKRKRKGGISELPVELLEEWCQCVDQLVCGDTSKLNEVEERSCKIEACLSPRSVENIGCPRGCRVSFGSWDAWKRHQKAQHREGGVKWTCDQCPELVFYDARQVSKHKDTNKTHRTSEQPSGVCNYGCGLCELEEPIAEFENWFEHVKGHVERGDKIKGWDYSLEMTTLMKSQYLEDALPQQPIPLTQFDLKVNERTEELRHDIQCIAGEGGVANLVERIEALVSPPKRGHPAMPTPAFDELPSTRQFSDVPGGNGIEGLEEIHISAASGQSNFSPADLHRHGRASGPHDHPTAIHDQATGQYDQFGSSLRPLMWTKRSLPSQDNPLGHDETYPKKQRHDHQNCPPLQERPKQSQDPPSLELTENSGSSNSTSLSTNLPLNGWSDSFPNQGDHTDLIEFDELFDYEQYSHDCENGGLKIGHPGHF
ncbi:uncharacterized protein PV07_05930 [Cladophialophora immunda]|uniref:Uncharacterized protein n=1 Tax=Cladophialophora immunda TaxID=569365 RepID=A0A0D1ZQ78_9EURO|nr:uncharacterized protein PV07_05930 [Cladophialophora immunda]KIW30166.1 hypothetical protein PV07_05930 [Cladophialophora immunda]